MQTDHTTTRKTLPIKVAIVEDDARLRQATADILRRAPDCDCIGEYASAEEALARIPQQQPQVVFMDINLPGMTGVECVRRLAEVAPGTQILMLTVHKDTESIFDALAAGAIGYLVKPVRAAQLLEAVRDAYGGGAPMTSGIARKVVQAFQKPSPPSSVVESLTPREQEVLDLLSQGYMYKEMALRMNISYATIRTHIERIYHKLHVRSRTQAVARYLGR